MAERIVRHAIYPQLCRGPNPRHFQNFQLPIPAWAYPLFWSIFDLQLYPLVHPQVFSRYVLQLGTLLHWTFSNALIQAYISLPLHIISLFQLPCNKSELSTASLIWKIFYLLLRITSWSPFTSRLFFYCQLLRCKFPAACLTWPHPISLLKNVVIRPATHTFQVSFFLKYSSYHFHRWIHLLC